MTVRAQHADHCIGITRDCGRRLVTREAGCGQRLHLGWRPDSGGYCMPVCGDAAGRVAAHDSGAEEADRPPQLGDMRADLHVGLRSAYMLLAPALELAA